MSGEVPEIVRVTAPVEPAMPNVLLSTMSTTDLDKKEPSSAAVASACVMPTSDRVMESPTAREKKRASKRDCDRQSCGNGTAETEKGPRTGTHKGQGFRASLLSH